MGLALFASPRPAHACSQSFDVIGVRESCRAYPAGAFVIAPSAPGADWTVDARLTGILGRTKTELDTSSAQRNAYRHAGPATGSFPYPVASYEKPVVCTVTITDQAAPATPPAFGTVDTRVTYVEGGSSGNGCSCSELDQLTVTPQSQPTILPSYGVVWFGPTIAEVTAERDPDGMFQVLPPTPPVPATDPLREARRPFAINVTLGEAEDHDRSGVGFGRTGRYCFTLAYMDDLGRTGDRSPPTCLNTRDTADPLVTAEDKGACICTALGVRSRLGSGAAGFFALACLVALGRRVVRRL